MRWMGLLVGAVIGYAVFLVLIAPLIGSNADLRAFGSAICVAAGMLLADRLIALLTRRQGHGA